jgi:hypothetical protein
VLWHAGRHAAHRELEHFPLRNQHRQQGGVRSISKRGQSVPRL